MLDHSPLRPAADPNVCPDAILSQLPLGGTHCKVERCLFGEVHFVACKGAVLCADQLMFGDSCICTNATRKDIFNRFKV